MVIGRTSNEIEAMKEVRDQALDALETYTTHYRYDPIISKEDYLLLKKALEDLV